MLKQNAKMNSLFFKNLATTLNLHLHQFSLFSFNYFSTSNFPSGFYSPSITAQDGMAMAEKDGPIEEKEKILSRPSKIPFQSKVANLVNFIGTVRKPVEFVTTTDGKSWAGTVISQDKNPYKWPFLWIPVIFEGDLAHTAANHLKLQDNVHVSGHLSPDPLPINFTNGRVDLQVMVHDLHFVRGRPYTKKNLHRFKATTTQQ